MLDIRFDGRDLRYIGLLRPIQHRRRIRFEIEFDNHLSGDETLLGKLRAKPPRNRALDRHLLFSSAADIARGMWVELHHHRYDCALVADVDLQLDFRDLAHGNAAEFDARAKREALHTAAEIRDRARVGSDELGAAEGEEAPDRQREAAEDERADHRGIALHAKG